MKTYKKVFIIIGAVILDFLITYYGVRLAVYLDWTPERFVYIWTVIILMIFGTPVALATVFYVVAMLVKVIHNIYIHIRHGIVYTDQEDI